MQHPKKGILLSLGVIALIFFLKPESDNTAQTDTLQRIPTVAVASVGSLSLDNEPLLVLGEVRSISQAELRTQKPGKVTQVYVSAGQFVEAGRILAEIDNASERAAVTSAQGALQAAQAQLDLVRKGARGEDKASVVVQAETALVTLQSAKDSARSAYSQGYSLAQDAIFAQADDFFSNVYTVNPSFRVTTASYDERTALEKERVLIGAKLEAWKQKTLSTIPDENIEQYLAEAEQDLEQIKSFLNRISSFVSEQKLTSDFTSADKATQEGLILGARSSVDGARSAINGARSGLASAVSAAKVTSFTESKTITGARSEEVASAEAFVTQARGALASAYAALENSLIRTPISGAVSTFNVSKGDFVSAYETVAVVANEGAQEVEAFVSDSARERITVGNKVRIDAVHEGTVTSVAPGLDPITKKSRITVGLTSDTSLVNGSFVEIMIQGNDAKAPEEIETKELSVPIASIKVLPRNLAVFTVSEEGVLVAHVVTEGPIVGSKMIVPEGLTLDMRIVTDVRGLSEGDAVEVEVPEIQE